MAKEQQEEGPVIINAFQREEEDKDFDLGPDEPELPLPLAVTSKVLYMLGDIAAGPAYRFTKWLEVVRRRSGRNRSSGFPHRAQHGLDSMPSLTSSTGDLISDSESSLHSEQAPEISLWERLGKAAMLDIESNSFSWDMLSSLHHTEHSSGTEHSEDEMNKALEVTINSGAAVIKISSSRMARVVHNCSPEWLRIKEAAEKARSAATLEGDEIGELTCSELLEALELSRCLLLMNYIHGSPLLDSSNAFDSQEAAEKTAAALGRILTLDLIIRNEDRLPCRQLRWRGNSANLLLADKMASTNMNILEESFDSAFKRYRPRVIQALEKERRSTSFDSRLNLNSGLVSQSSDLSDVTESPKSSNISLKSQSSNASTLADCNVVAIDSGVPRRPPAGKRVNDQENYPKLVELLINSSDYSSNLLYEITRGKLGSPPDDADVMTDLHLTDITSVVHEFQRGFRSALRDLQGFQIFLLTLHQKLDSLLRVFMDTVNRTSLGEYDKEDLVVSESPPRVAGIGVHCPSPPNKEGVINDNHSDVHDPELLRTAPRLSSSGCKESPDSGSSISSISRDGWHGKFNKGSAETLRSLRMTSKLRDFHKFAKVDVELNKELEQWNEILRNDALKLCQENNFNTGFFEGSDNNSVVDAYELKVRLGHTLERIALVSDAANTEKPSSISCSLFIGGALAARSVYTLQHLGITHILCLCSNEIGQSDSQYPDLFEYKNFAICDEEDANISSIFEEAHDFIDHIEQTGRKVLVHCFEGRSRSATVILAYLMLRKNLTLLEAWNRLKKVHRRVHPNDGFAKILLELDKKQHGKVSMEWQQRKPMMKVCPICGKNAGLSSSSLKLHLQKEHKRLSSGSVDSAMTMEIQKALTALKMSHGGSVSQW
ncbi:unnamed protein product [Camellia sinensis]